MAAEVASSTPVPTLSTVMTPEEEAEMEEAASLRRSRHRGRAMYGGPAPDIDSIINNEPGVHIPNEYSAATLKFTSSGISEPNQELIGDPKKIRSHSQRLRVGYAETIGRRPSMEDEIIIAGQLRYPDEDFIAVFDGHSGSAASSYAAKNLHTVLISKLSNLEDPAQALKETFIEVNEMMRRDGISGGTTALVVYFMKDRCYIANAGDSRAVLGEGNKALRCTVDHRPDDPVEEARITQSGAHVTRISKNGKVISRINGMLAVSRALGDLAFHESGLTSEPDVKEIQISKEHQVLVLACDGLWDVVSDEEAVQIAANDINPQKAAVKLRDTAYAKGSGDNISVIVIRIPSDYAENIPQANQGPSGNAATSTTWKVFSVCLVVVAVSWLWARITKLTNQH